MSGLDDPRVLFAAERTLLAWNRTCLALMAFGFMIERFGLFVRVMLPAQVSGPGSVASIWLGLAFIVLSALFLVASAIQHRHFIKTLHPAEIPEGYWLRMPIVFNLILTAMTIVLGIYMVFSLPDR
jgi:putative membrane protein